MDKKKLDDLFQNYRTTFGTVQGQNVLEDLESRLHQNTTTFSKDSLEMAYLEGQRSVLLMIKNIIKEKNKK